MSRPLRTLALVLGLGAFATSQEKPRAPSSSAPASRPASRPFLWRIEGKPAAWLFGTVHVADPRLTSLPPAVARAFEASDVLVTEGDLSQLAIMRAMRAATLPGRQQLVDVLPAATWRRLSAWLDRHQISAVTVARLRVWVAATMVTTQGVNLRQRNAVVLDRRLVELAMEAGKEIAALEAPEEQMRLFNDFTTEEQIRLLDGTLDLVERAEKDGRSLTQVLIDRYLAGDVDTLLDDARRFSGLHADPELERRFLKAMLDDRNVVMVDRMLARMQAHPDKVHFVAVGAGHLAGPRGMPALLAEKGVRVTRVQ